MSPYDKAAPFTQHLAKGKAGFADCRRQCNCFSPNAELRGLQKAVQLLLPECRAAERTQTRWAGTQVEGGQWEGALRASVAPSVEQVP